MEVVDLHVSGLIPALPDRLYAAWLDERDHASFTGGRSAQIEGKVGGAFATGDGRYVGKITKLRPGAQISFTLRTKDFPELSEDSKVTVSFDARSDGDTLIEIRHSKVPAPLGPEFERHWLDHYVMPMRVYFAALPPSEPAEAKPSPSPPKKAEVAKDEGKASASTGPVESMAKKPPAKKTAAKKAPAKKTAAKKAPAKKTAAKKTAAKKTAAKKPPGKKAPAKKAPAKKTAAKKTAAKKAPAKKTASSGTGRSSSTRAAPSSKKKRTAAKKKARTTKKKTH